MNLEQFLDLVLTPELLAFFEKDLKKEEEKEESRAENEAIKNLLKEIESGD